MAPGHKLRHPCNNIKSTNNLAASGGIRENGGEKMPKQIINWMDEKSH